MDIALEHDGLGDYPALGVRWVIPRPISFGVDLISVVQTAQKAKS